MDELEARDSLRWKADCGIIDDVWVFDMQREGWIEPKVGELRQGENPRACVACPQ